VLQRVNQQPRALRNEIGVQRLAATNLLCQQVAQVLVVPTTEPKAPAIDPETAAKPAINPEFMDGISTCYHACGVHQTVTSSRASTEISALKSLDTGQPV
jgi:hypothetical protein